MYYVPKYFSLKSGSKNQQCQNYITSKRLRWVQFLVCWIMKYLLLTYYTSSLLQIILSELPRFQKCTSSFWEFWRICQEYFLKNCLSNYFPLDSFSILQYDQSSTKIKKKRRGGEMFIINCSIIYLYIKLWELYANLQAGECTLGYFDTLPSHRCRNFHRVVNIS